MPSRQAIHAQKKRAARGLKAKGRTPWACGTCGGSARSKRGDGTRKCDVCHPAARRGRPRKIQLPPSTAAAARNASRPTVV